MVIDDSKVKKEDLTDTNIPESVIQQEIQPKVKTIKDASVSELISFSKFTLTGVLVFVVSLVIQTIIQQIQFEGYDRWVLAVMGVAILFLFGGLVVDILNWREYTEWGALGAIIAYIGVFIIFIPFLLQLFWYEDEVLIIYIIMWIFIGPLTVIIGFTTRATEFDQKIIDQFIIFNEWRKAGGIRQALSALKQLIVTIVKGFFKYIGLGFKELGTRIRKFGSWMAKSTKFVLKRSGIFFTKTLPNLIARSLIGLWNNLHWFGLIAVIIYLITVDVPISNADPLILKAVLLLIVSFFFCLGVLYPQRDRIVVIAKNMSDTVLTGVISAYSMLSGAKIETDQSVFCSRCLRGIENREFKSLVIIKGMIDPPCPFCGFKSWIGSEKLSFSKEELKQKDKPIIPSIQETSTKDLPTFEMSISDKKAIKKGKFPNYQTYTRAQNLGVQTYSELEFIDRLGAPDFETAEKIKKGGYSHFQTYKKGLTVGASSASELYLIEELQAPDVAAVKEVQKGNFPDYQSYQRAQELGAKDYSDLRHIERYGAPDFETAEKVRMGGFSEFQTFKKAQSLGASTASELSFIEELAAPDLATAKKIQEGRFPDYQTYKHGQEYGVQNYQDLRLINRFGAPDLETARKIRDNGFTDYETFQRAQDIGARTYSEFQFMTKEVGITSDGADVVAGTQAMVTEKLTKVKSPKSIVPTPDSEVKATLIDQKAVDARISVLELGEKVAKLNQSIESTTWNIEWRDWFIRQTKLYQEEQIGERTYKHMLRRLQDQYLHKVPQITQQHDEQSLDELQTLVDGILTGKTALVLDSTPRTQFPTQDAVIDEVKIQTNQRSSIIDKRDLGQETIMKEEIWFSEERESLMQAIEVFDEIFSDQFTPRGQQELSLWNAKKSWFKTQRKRFLRGNISTGMFYNKIKRLDEELRSTFRVPEEKFQVIRSQQVMAEKTIPDLLKELLKVSQSLTEVDTEIDEWYRWLDTQINLYLKSQLRGDVFQSMLNRTQRFLLDLDTSKLHENEMKALDKTKALINDIFRELTFSIHRNTKKCPSCGVDIPETSQYCNKCGTKLPD